MIMAKYLSEMWSAVAPAVGNHLWQSTLFAIVAGLLTLVLRKNQARARYWIWMAASLKFLIPFSLLVWIGSQVGWSRASDGSETGFTFAMDELSQPFTQPMGTVIFHATGSTTPTLFANVAHLLSIVLPALWLCGFLAVLFVWGARWCRISTAMREAAPLHAGREVDALRRMECAGGIRKRIDVFLSRASLEPGIFGIARPILVWPEGISARLDDAHVEAIVAHEVGHVRRRDNLFAAVHMVVQAIFWFHPLVWFLGTRLVEEREVACDEQVLELGSERQVYAESILKICEFCVESPLACVSGIKGSDLKRRIVRIMTRDDARKLNFRKKLLLTTAGFAAIATPILFGLAHAPSSRAQSQLQNTSWSTFEYEVASIKPHPLGDDSVGLRYTPDGLIATNMPMSNFVRLAYGVAFASDDGRILGGPRWVSAERYDIDAKMESSVAEALQKLSQEERSLARQHMLQTLLADRLKLVIHRETRDLPVYALIVAKNGPKLSDAKPEEITVAAGRGGRGSIQMRGRGGPLVGQALSMGELVSVLSMQMGRPVLDKTGLTGKYDFSLQWSPDETANVANIPGGATNGQPPANSSDSNGPSIFTAIQEQLGLKLDSQKGPVEVVVIDHVERLSGN